MRQTIQRGINGVRKIVAGLKPFSESVWPGVRNDLFVAHESIYSFCARFARGRSVLDAGCGTGHGAFLLVRAGAVSTIGVDLDPRNIRFARKRYAHPTLSFQTGDLEDISFPQGSFGLVVASNSLEHLDHPERFLERMREMLTGDGQAIVAVPPIYGEDELRAHAGIHYHRSNLPVREWARLFQAAGFAARGVLHEAPGVAPDFRSHLPSSLRSEDFVFTEVPVEELWNRPSITAIFVIDRS